MQKTILGRTGLEVTVAGLGCGGFSRLGIDRELDHAASIVRKAYDAGVNFFDTAAIYGTQEAVGKGLNGLPRNSYVLSTKFSYRDSRGAATLQSVQYADARLGITGEAYTQERFFCADLPELFQRRDAGFHKLALRDLSDVRHI